MFKELLRHTRHSLDPLFNPSAIAVIGASTTPGKVGYQVMKNLISGGFSGVVYPVNPNHRAVLGVRSFPGLHEIPEPIELALVCTAAQRVQGIFQECISQKVPVVIILTAGFGELGEQGKALEASLKSLARASSTRLLGPNCLGVINPLGNLNATFAQGSALPGRLALVSQSGALCTSILDWSLKTGIGFSRLVSLGAMVDVDFADLIDYLGDDGPTKSILLYIESVGDARRFMSAARQVARTKPIIVVKAGRSPVGARAAISHTGALTGSDDVCDAAFRRAGVLRVNELSDLFAMAEVLASQPLPQGNKLLTTEVESKQVFRSYGIPAVETQIARNEEEAIALARKMGFPVVLKVHSIEITHKAAIGGVRLNLLAEQGVRIAFQELENLIREVAPGAQFEGISVQPMITGKGFEAILGCAVDEQFGPIILFGSGGSFVEILRDRAVGLPPMNRTVARRLIESTKLYSALVRPQTGFEANLEQLEEIIVRFSTLVINHPEIKEIDVNPLWIGRDRILALDGRIALYPPVQDRPPLAISPYPRQYESDWALKDGTPVHLRPIRPEDEPLEVDLFTTLSEQTIYMRFFGMIRQLTHEQLVRFCNIDYGREIALVAVARQGESQRIIGVARLVMEPDWQTAEYAVVVGDPWQHQGLGRHFMELMIRYGKERGIREIHGDVLAANDPMLRLCEKN
ncbi:MAG: GNAT family N-acetyltransferase [Acidobacteria bacterium]|nr:GNAT family N-acetyltransferase [Acidobacteriota bacterium]